MPYLSIDIYTYIYTIYIHINRWIFLASELKFLFKNGYFSPNQVIFINYLIVYSIICKKSIKAGKCFTLLFLHILQTLKARTTNSKKSLRKSLFFTLFISMAPQNKITSNSGFVYELNNFTTCVNTADAPQEFHGLMNVSESMQPVLCNDCNPHPVL